MDENTPMMPGEEPKKPDLGAKGGEAAFAAPYPVEHEAIGPRVAATIVRWSPIWMGFLTTIGLYLVLSMLGIAIALSVVDRTTTGTIVGDLGRATALTNGIAALIALFVGGLLAGRHGVHFGYRSPWTQGTAVWSLYLIAALIAGALGFSAVGMAGAGAFGGVSGTTPSIVAVREALSRAALAAWTLFGAAAIGWLLAVGGAWLGQSSVEQREPGHEHR